VDDENPVDPTPENTEEPNNDPDVLGTYIPQTGDNTNVSLYFMLMMLGIIMILVASKKKEETR
jgi:LPXTG-motif cell wall-anchored protein